ncbi:hypothetical protein T492DRAFT_317468 [Pavlovales sp. CCMP2436]|nr:hypothetical protein T492DRAFT_317468 [Pavlovales sp. CCMP2436]
MEPNRCEWQELGAWPVRVLARREAPAQRVRHSALFTERGVADRGVAERALCTGLGDAVGQRPFIRPPTCEDEVGRSPRNDTLLLPKHAQDSAMLPTPALVTVFELTCALDAEQAAATDMEFTPSSCVTGGGGNTTPLEGSVRAVTFASLPLSPSPFARSSCCAEKETASGSEIAEGGQLAHVRHRLALAEAAREAAEDERDKLRRANERKEHEFELLKTSQRVLRRYAREQRDEAAAAGAAARLAEGVSVVLLQPACRAVAWVEIGVAADAARRSSGYGSAYEGSQQTSRLAPCRLSALLWHRVRLALSERAASLRSSKASALLACIRLTHTDDLRAASARGLARSIDAHKRAEALSLWLDVLNSQLGSTPMPSRIFWLEAVPRLQRALATGGAATERGGSFAASSSPAVTAAALAAAEARLVRCVFGFDRRLRLRQVVAPPLQWRWHDELRPLLVDDNGAADEDKLDELGLYSPPAAGARLSSVGRRRAWVPPEGVLRSVRLLVVSKPLQILPSLCPGALPVGNGSAATCLQPSCFWLVPAGAQPAIDASLRRAKQQTRAQPVRPTGEGARGTPVAEVRRWRDAVNCALDRLVLPPLSAECAEKLREWREEIAHGRTPPVRLRLGRNVPPPSHLTVLAGTQLEFACEECGCAYDLTFGVECARVERARPFSMVLLSPAQLAFELTFDEPGPTDGARRGAQAQRHAASAKPGTDTAKFAVVLQVETPPAAALSARFGGPLGEAAELPRGALAATLREFGFAPSPDPTRG